MYKEFHKGKNNFDFSEHPENSKFHDKANKNVIGQIKNKTEGFPIVDFVGLKSKMCFYIRKMIQETKRLNDLIKTLLKICHIKNIKMCF